MNKKSEVIEQKILAIYSYQYFLEKIFSPKYQTIFNIEKYEVFFSLIQRAFFDVLIVELHSIFHNGRYDNASISRFIENLSDEAKTDFSNIKIKHENTIKEIGTWRPTVAHSNENFFEVQEVKIDLFPLLNDFNDFLEKWKITFVKFEELRKEIQECDNVMEDLSVCTSTLKNTKILDS